jgi:hypothetical protein
MRFLPRSEPREEELAALADDTLAPERRAAVEAMVERSPELAARLVEQRRALALVRGAAETVGAPAVLRARVEARRRPVATPLRRPRVVWAAGVGAAAVAVAVALVLALPENVPGGPSVAEAAVLTVRPATAGPPRATSPNLLAEAVDGVAFPNWVKKFGWKATGVRLDSLDGRRATTVFYEKGGHRIGYTIFAGDALKTPDGGASFRRGGIPLRLLTVGGRPVVTWLRRGQTCILSGADAEPGTLAKLAAWKGKGSVQF